MVEQIICSTILSLLQYKKLHNSLFIDVVERWNHNLISAFQFRKSD